MSEAPNTEITFIKPDFGHALRIWWAWTWRASLYGLLAAIVVPIVLQPLMIVVILLFGGTHRAADLVSDLLGTLISVSAEVYVLWALFYKDFGQFGLRLVQMPEPPGPVQASDLLAPTLGHAVRIWWAWFWRTLLGGFAITFLVSLVVTILQPPPQVQSVVVLAVAIASFLSVSLYCMRFILDRKFKGFSLRLVSSSSAF